MKLRASLLLALSLALPGMARAQTARDSTHAQATKPRVDTLSAALNRFCLTKTARSFSYVCATKRQITALRLADSTLIASIAPPPPDTAPTPVPTPTPVIHYIAIAAGDSSLTVGQTTTVTGLAKDVSGNTLAVPITWSTANSTVATVSGSGTSVIVTAKGPGSTAVIATADTVTRSLDIIVADTAPTPTTPPDTVIVGDPVPTPGAPGALFTHPYAPWANGALMAQFPRDTMGIAPLPVSRVVRCTDVQACLDSARVGDELRLAPGSTSGPITIRRSNLTLRTDVSDTQLGGPWERMTVTKAASLNLATITSSTTDSPVIFAAGVHDVQLVGIRVSTTNPATTTTLVRVGYGETDTLQLPKNIVLKQIVIDPGTHDVRRCLVMDGYRMALLSSTLANCHSNAGDSQGISTINGRGVFRIENNTIQGGHQCILTGGGDPSIVGQVPSDVVFRRNDCSRPLAWNGVWQTKTIFEMKIGKRWLVEGNYFRRTWADAQAGFGVLLKSENQDGGTGDWSETADITFRYNAIIGAAAGLDVAGLVQGPGVAMSRVSIYGNVADSINVAPYTGDTGDALMTLGVADVVYVDNWTRNPTGRSAIYMVSPSPRFVATRNTFGGQYGIRGEGGLSYTAPGSIITNNTQLPWGTAFSAWPAATADSTRSALLSGVIVVP